MNQSWTPSFVYSPYIPLNNIIHKTSRHFYTSYTLNDAVAKYNNGSPIGSIFQLQSKKHSYVIYALHTLIGLKYLDDMKVFFQQHNTGFIYKEKVFAQGKIIGLYVNYK